MRPGKRHDDRRYPRTPEGVLAQKWRHLNLDALRAYLVRLIVLELHTYPRPPRDDGYPRHRHLRHRLRARRRSVAKRFVSLGGRINPQLSEGMLPHGKCWPGVVCLVETRGFEEHMQDVA
jgi:hypothetical protein